MITKQYIYRVKSLKEKLNFSHMLALIFQMESDEKSIARSNNTYVKHFVKWRKLIEL